MERASSDSGTLNTDFADPVEVAVRVDGDVPFRDVEAALARLRRLNVQPFKCIVLQIVRSSRHSHDFIDLIHLDLLGCRLSDVSDNRLVVRPSRRLAGHSTLLAGICISPGLATAPPLTSGIRH
ncbi:MAG: hypothetical protein EON58_20830, partial [Alphaproteobacteria bacterium]